MRRMFWSKSKRRAAQDEIADPEGAGRAPPRVPPGLRVYAVGDVHGRLDLLDELLAMIAADDVARAPARTHLVMLGDLIDRGPQSAGVIERLRTYRNPRIELSFVAGNHEEVLLRMLGGEEGLLEQWLQFGGAECIASYGLDPDSLAGASAPAAVALVRDTIPSAHQQFLHAFDDTLKIGDYLFVHAGIRPGVPLSLQVQRDLRWIRQPFLDDERDHGLVVVHGHTISEAVAERSNRIGIDTGAYATGRLTAVGLEADERWFLHT